MELNESTIKQLAEVLENGLEQEINERNAELTDGFALDPPAQILDYMPVPATYGGGLPIVGVQDLPARFSNDLQHSMEGTYGLGLCALMQTPDHQTLAWQLRRYIQAIANVIQADRELGPLSLMRKPPANVIYLEFAGTQPGPLLANTNPDNDGEAPVSFRSWSWLLLECRRQEIGG